MDGFLILQYDAIRRILEKAHENFFYVTDEKKWKVAEYWEGEKLLQAAIEGNVRFRGDCEDFAVVCMGKLRAKNLKARLVICKTETGEGHCICEVASDDMKEAYFLDNRYKTLQTRRQLKGYTFHSTSPWNPQPGDRRPWKRVVQPKK